MRPSPSRSGRLIHRELHYFDMDTTWQSKGTQEMFNATLDEWQRQVIHLGHAWRCYNQKVDDESENMETMTLETTITDLIEQNTKLGRERAAAVNHFTCILALAPAIYRWKKKLPKFFNYSAMARDNMSKIDGYIGRVQQSLMLTPEILENHGYNVMPWERLSRPFAPTAKMSAIRSATKLPRLERQGLVKERNDFEDQLPWERLPRPFAPTAKKSAIRSATKLPRLEHPELVKELSMVKRKLPPDCTV